MEVTSFIKQSLYFYSPNFDECEKWRLHIFIFYEKIFGYNIYFFKWCIFSFFFICLKHVWTENLHEHIKYIYWAAPFFTCFLLCVQSEHEHFKEYNKEKLKNGSFGAWSNSQNKSCETLLKQDSSKMIGGGGGGGLPIKRIY